MRWNRELVSAKQGARIGETGKPTGGIRARPSWHAKKPESHKALRLRGIMRHQGRGQRSLRALSAYRQHRRT